MIEKDLGGHAAGTVESYGPVKPLIPQMPKRSVEQRTPAKHPGNASLIEAFVLLETLTETVAQAKKGTGGDTLSQ